jgi:uncharacterized membrane protein
MIWLKFLHLSAIAVWAGGLICLPGLYMQRLGVPHRTALHNLHAMVRFLYVGIISPAAFLAIGSGAALIFLRHTFENWFTLKLALVGVLAVLHLFTGMVVVRLFGEEAAQPSWRFGLLMGSTMVTATAILVVVLAKPELPGLLSEDWAEPGGLRRMVLSLFPRS